MIFLWVFANMFSSSTTVFVLWNTKNNWFLRVLGIVPRPRQISFFYDEPTTQIKTYETARACFSEYIAALLHCSDTLNCAGPRWKSPHGQSWGSWRWWSWRLWSWGSWKSTRDGGPHTSRAEETQSGGAEEEARESFSPPGRWVYNFFIRQFQASPWYSHWKVCDQLLNDIKRKLTFWELTFWELTFWD